MNTIKKELCQFPSVEIAKVQDEIVEGQLVEKRLDFSWQGLDYSFVFYPNTDLIEDGATLTYVGNNKQGRLSPSQYAVPGVWEIANRKMGLISSSAPVYRVRRNNENSARNSSKREKSS